jgi:hypothetical protein
VQEKGGGDDARVVGDVDRGGRQEAAVRAQRGAEVPGHAEGEKSHGGQPRAVRRERRIGQPRRQHPNQRRGAGRTRARTRVTVSTAPLLPSVVMAG